MESLDLLANNLANGATAGYKMDREYYNLNSGDDEDSLGLVDNGSAVPVIERNWTDFSQGNLQTSGNPLDLAISGRGFFAVNGESGTLFTRNGNFHLAPNGTLVTRENYTVKAEGGGVIKSRSSAPIDIGPNGNVKQDGVLLGRLEVVDFKDSAKLSKQGGAFFTNADPKAPPTPAQNAQVLQGKIESSNVVVSESAVRLVGVMRQFEMLQKAITLSSEMNRKAVEEVAKVNG
jgi:flagellar basal-body rod protein FlgF